LMGVHIGSIPPFWRSGPIKLPRFALRTFKPSSTPIVFG
jgi:hypothetical protein